MKNITIASPSWKRAATCITHKYLPSMQYVVCSSQAEDYRANGLPVWECPDSAQGNVSRVRNWILDNSPTKNTLILDDDFYWLGRWNKNQHARLSTEDALEFIEQGFFMAEQFGVRFWGVNILMDKTCYVEHTPFALKAMVLGPFGGFLDPDLRYDETLPLKEDYDMSLQMLNRHRKILRFNFMHYKCKQHTNPGGCAEYRTLDTERSQFSKLQKKWGGEIVRIDDGNRQSGRKAKAAYDINPRINRWSIPIGGV